GSIETAYTYDAMDRVRVAVEAVEDGPDAQTTESFYDLAGNVTFVLDPKGIETSYEYDVLDRVVRTTAADDTPEEEVTETFYDAVGNVTRVLDPNGLETTYHYDPP